MDGEARVLVVDDEHALRKLLRLYLEREGYDVWKPTMVWRRCRRCAVTVSM
jgi:DNA-binding response OmpR family regulator